MNDYYEDNKRYLLLAEKWLNGTILPHEEEEYAAWYATLSDEDKLEIPAAFAGDKEQHRKKILSNINLRRKAVIPFRRRLMYKSAIAASFVLVITITAYLVSNRKESKDHLSIVKEKDIGAHDIKPGTNGAVLTLSNGKTILIDTVKNGNIQLSTGNEVAKTGDRLNFRSKEAGTGIEEYTLVTPKARQQQLTLPDGSKVWLNAASSIRFPSAFTSKTRLVEITGEAYFEVAKEKSKAFVVKVGSAKVEVLGTHFNLMAYPNEQSLETTLLEGAVRFSSDKQTIQLKPGQQSQLLPGNKLRLNEHADIEHAIAWKNGIQSFKSADIKTIMRQVERWYDVKVEYKGAVPQREFTGDFPRSANLSELLRLFEINDIHIQLGVDRRTITVLP